MRKLKIRCSTLKYNFILLSFILFLSKSLLSNEVLFEIEGNDFTDTTAIISILKDIPESPNKEYTNDIIRILNNTNLFSDVQVKLEENKYLIIVQEYPNIDKINFKNNERLQDDELQKIALDTNFTKFNSSSINIFTNELIKTYATYGYNNVQINYEDKIIRCDNLDLNIDKNIAVAYNNVTVQGNNSFMKTNKITLNILTKDININSDDKIEITAN